MKKPIAFILVAVIVGSLFAATPLWHDTYYGMSIEEFTARYPEAVLYSNFNNFQEYTLFFKEEMAEIDISFAFENAQLQAVLLEIESELEYPFFRAFLVAKYGKPTDTFFYEGEEVLLWIDGQSLIFTLGEDVMYFSLEFFPGYRYF